MSEQIVVGDWVVAGQDGTDGLDIGCIVSLDGDMAVVGWAGGTSDELDLTRDDVEVFASKAAAESRYAARAKVEGNGTLMAYETGDTLRPATHEERMRSVHASDIDGGAGVIVVAGRLCYVED